MRPTFASCERVAAGCEELHEGWNGGTKLSHRPDPPFGGEPEVGRLRGCLLQTLLPEAQSFRNRTEERFKSRVALQRREALVR